MSLLNASAPSNSTSTNPFDLMSLLQLAQFVRALQAAILALESRMRVIGFLALSSGSILAASVLLNAVCFGLMVKHRGQWRIAHSILSALILTDLVRIPKLVHNLFKKFLENNAASSRALNLPMTAFWCRFEHFFPMALCPLSHSLILLLSVDKILALFAPFKHRLLSRKVYPLCICSLIFIHLGVAVLALVPLVPTTSQVAGRPAVLVCLSDTKHPLAFLSKKGGSFYYDGVIHVMLLLLLDATILMKTSEIMINQRKMAQPSPGDAADSPRGLRLRAVLRLVAMQALYIVCRSGAVLEWIVLSEEMKKYNQAEMNIIQILNSFSQTLYKTYNVFYYLQYLPDALLFVFILWDCRFIRESFRPAKAKGQMK